MPADMSIGATGTTFPAVEQWQMSASQSSVQPASGHVAPATVTTAACDVYREPASAPLRKLSIGLIHTYKHINEV